MRRRSVDSCDSQERGIIKVAGPSTVDSRLAIDLLTVVMHELGHVTGLDDLHDSAAEDDLMFGWLEAGQRNVSLAASLADRAFGEF